MVELQLQGEIEESEEEGSEEDDEVKRQSRIPNTFRQKHNEPISSCFEFILAGERRINIVEDKVGTSAQ